MAAAPENSTASQSSSSNEDLSSVGYTVQDDTTRGVSNSASSPTITALEPEMTTALSAIMPAFFELCVKSSKTRISLGEIVINDSQGKSHIKSDMQLFSKMLSLLNARRHST